MFCRAAITMPIIQKPKRSGPLSNVITKRRLRTCDAILTPTSPSVAFKIGERSDDPLAMYLSDIYTVSANLAGVPAISVPCGLSSDGLPIGMQLVGNFWSEGELLNLAHATRQPFPLDGQTVDLCRVLNLLGKSKLRLSHHALADSDGVRCAAGKIFCQRFLSASSRSMSADLQRL